MAYNKKECWKRIKILEKTDGENEYKVGLCSFLLGITKLGSFTKDIECYANKKLHHLIARASARQDFERHLRVDRGDYSLEYDYSAYDEYMRRYNYEREFGRALKDLEKERKKEAKIKRWNILCDLKKPASKSIQFDVYRSLGVIEFIHKDNNCDALAYIEQINSKYGMLINDVLFIFSKMKQYNVRGNCLTIKKALKKHYNDKITANNSKIKNSKDILKEIKAIKDDIDRFL